MAITHSGACLCGDVHVEASGAPKWVANCHCRDCQKATGAAFATYAGFDVEHVTIDGDSVVERQSSPGVNRAFCGTCGAPIFYRSDKWPGEIHLFTALLDDAGDLAPMANVQMAEAVPWLHLGDGVPQFQRFAGDAGSE